MADAVTTKDFEDKVSNSKGLVLVDFWADWCGPCHALAPILDKVADDVKDDAAVYKLNVDENQDTAIKYQIMGIPTVKLFKDGKEVESVTGVRQQKEYLDLIEKHKG